VGLDSNIPGMGKKVRWGILGTAGIATRKAIPGMQKSDWVEVTAIASRDRRKAEDAASALGIPKAYGSYEELLADPEIEAVYNPLPNQLHVPWSIKAAEAGKHVLCEKPLSMTVAEAKSLLAVQERTGVIIAEGFMVHGHPQWLRAHDLIGRQNREPPFHSRGVQLLQHRPCEHPQRSGIWRRKPDGHRMLSHPHLPMDVRRRAGARDGSV
jgi:predicted dehydrogenase